MYNCIYINSRKCKLTYGDRKQIGGGPQAGEEEQEREGQREPQGARGTSVGGGCVHCLGRGGVVGTSKTHKKCKL